MTDIAYQYDILCAQMNAGLVLKFSKQKPVVEMTFRIQRNPIIKQQFSRLCSSVSMA
jgi:hypothetical protein